MTQTPRLFVDADLAPPGPVTLSGDQTHYLGTVMRRRPGDPVLLFNGRDGEWRARVAALSRHAATLTLEERTRAQAAEPGPWLVFALLKRDATDLVVRMATELGVAAILPVITARTNAARVNAVRLRAIAVEAAEQSERLTVPEIHSPTPLGEVLAAWPADRRLFVAAERRDAPSLRPCAGPAALLVGPEGGFAAAELDGLQGLPIVTMISFGPRILRAETACLAGLALLRTPGCG